jgi:hypothetical protein
MVTGRDGRRESQRGQANHAVHALLHISNRRGTNGIWKMIWLLMVNNNELVVYIGEKRRGEGISFDIVINIMKTEKGKRMEGEKKEGVGEMDKRISSK